MSRYLGNFWKLSAAKVFFPAQLGANHELSKILQAHQVPSKLGILQQESSFFVFFDWIFFPFGAGFFNTRFEKHPD